jgi:NAD-dependent deacetylase
MNIIVFTGSGISQESGIPTFRDTGGTWDNYNVDEVASIEGFIKNPQVVLDFYNSRRQKLHTVQPNAAHYALVELEKYHNVTIVTQNVDDLHERAGSSNVIHLHGRLTKCRDTITNELYDYDNDINVGSLSPNGNQLRPDIVWFGELVMNMPMVDHLCKSADCLIIIGSSLAVSPASQIAWYVPESSDIIVVDKDIPYVHREHKQYIGNATEQVPIMVNDLKF